jgi:hypothetical protein
MDESPWLGDATVWACFGCAVRDLSGRLIGNLLYFKKGVFMLYSWDLVGFYAGGMDDVAPSRATRPSHCPTDSRIALGMPKQEPVGFKITESATAPHKDNLVTLLPYSCLVFGRVVQRGSIMVWRCGW